jgi:hypothetical protein
MIFQYFKVLIMITDCKSNDNEMSLILILYIWFYNLHFIASSTDIYVLWPENVLKQKPKHVVSLNKTTKTKTELCCDLLLTHILLLYRVA